MPRRILEGNVVSAKTDKTITVLVERRFMHPMYKKYVKSSSKYKAHDEANTYKEGDRVSIIECRPISKTKSWTVLTEGEKVKSDEEKTVSAATAKKAEAKKAEEKKPAKKATTKAKAEPKKETAKKAAAKKDDAKKKAPAKKKPAASKAKATKKDAK